MDDLPKRKNHRLRYFDYHTTAMYHVVICAQRHACLFGTVNNGRMDLNQTGMIADENARMIPQKYPEAELVEYAVMPNHVHLLLGLGTKERDDHGETGANYGAPTGGHSLGQIVRAYKASVTMMCGQSIWQRGYYDHIIRNENDWLDTIVYIQNNPAAWDDDDLNPVSPLGTP